MQTVLEILRAAGQLCPGFCLRIENEPYMRLVIEDIQIPGPNGHNSISAAHYGEQSGDPMRDPEMLFELVEDGGKVLMVPYYYRNDYAGVELYSRTLGDGGSLVDRRLFRDQQAFSRMWDRNLRAQGFLEAFRRERGNRPSTLFQTL